MKILFGMPAKDSWGGPIACEPPFVAALRDLGVETAEEIYVYGDKERPTAVFERIRRVVATALRFRRIVKNGSFDLIHLNTSFDLRTLFRDTISIFVMRPEKARLFLKLHGSDPKSMLTANAFVRFMISYLIGRVDGFGVLSSEERDAFLELGFPADKLFVVKNAIVMPEIARETEIRGERGRIDAFDILFVSRFMPAKGLLETIRACAILKHSGISLMLYCVGDGEIREMAEREVTALNLTDNIAFTGYIPEAEVAKYFRTSDIFVFPTSHIEGLPLALFKAAIAGMPVVTTNIRAATDYLREPENCLFCTSDPENIAANIVKLIGDKALRQKMRENNVKFGEVFAPPRIAGEYLDIYTNLTHR